MQGNIGAGHEAVNEKQATLKRERILCWPHVLHLRLHSNVDRMRPLRFPITISAVVSPSKLSSYPSARAQKHDSSPVFHRFNKADCNTKDVDKMVALVLIRSQPTRSFEDARCVNTGPYWFRQTK